MYEVLDGLLDLSYSDCKSQNIYREEDFEQFKINEPYIGIVDTSIYYDMQAYLRPLSSFYQLRNLGYNNMENALEKHEQIIDVKNMRLIQKLKYKENIVNQRREIVKKLEGSSGIQGKSASLNQNMIVIYVDAISRQRAMKKLPKTMEFFKNQNDMYEFLKFHSLVGWTDQNAQMFMYGNAYLNGSYITNKTVQSSIFEFFQEQGFITGKSQNYCEFSYYTQPPSINEIQPHKVFDHENVAFSCDPHYHNKENPHLPNSGPYSIFRHCLYGKDTYEHVLDFGTQFMNLYPKDKKLLVLNFIDNHEGTGEVVKYLDQPLTQFMTDMQQKHPNTTILLMSDHGWHMNGLGMMMTGKDQSMVEKHLPVLYIANLGNSLSELEKSNLIYNQQKLFSKQDAT
eukprot:403376333